MKFYNNDINIIAINALIDCGELELTNIGALRCRLLPATIKNGAITPPRQIIEFHSTAHVGANSLTQIIAWSYNVPVAEAETAYDTWLANIKAETSSFAIYSIAGLGTIQISENGTSIFIADTEFLAQLNPLSQKPSDTIQESAIHHIKEMIEKEKRLEGKEEIEENREAEKKSEKENKEKEESKHEEENESQDKCDNINIDNTSIVDNNYWRNIAIIFISLFIIASALSFYLYIKKPTEVIREIKIEKIIKDTIFVNSTNLQNEQKQNTITDGRFHIIGGVFKTLANAEKAAKAFTKDGVTPIIEFIKEREEYFVSVASFDTKQDAQKYLNTLGLANEKTYESYWIYKF
ncbi:MAG: SPOR domain-containing protein [Rikenellaceae bacterium]